MARLYPAKSLSDDREYATVVLPNKLEVMLIRLVRCFVDRFSAPTK